MNLGPVAALAIGIAAELVATTALKLSDGFTKPWWIAGVALGYGVAFWMFAIAVRSIPVGVAYASWAGVGIVGTAIVGFVVFRQALTPLTTAGIGLILAGTIVAGLGLREP